MATARERLIQALSVIISQPFSDDGKNALNRLLNSYRVQTKPSEDASRNHTARDELSQKLIEAWKTKGLSDRKTIERIISSFRMQLKQGLSAGRPIEPRPKASVHSSTEIINQENSHNKRKETSLKHENAYFKDKASLYENNDVNAIAGGPKHGINARGQCPKCRSMGIVLARAYAGDDYHSCIYCGYQAYLKEGDPNIDLPLAAELLQALKEPKRDDED